MNWSSTASGERRRPSIELSVRDRAIVDLVAHLRLISGGQLELVFFPVSDHPTAATAARLCRRALARLVEAGYLSRLARRIGGVRAGSHGYVYGLGGAGRRLLDLGGRRSRLHEPGLAFVDHRLAVSQLVVDLTVTARDGRFDLLRVEAEPQCWRQLPSLARVTLRPDLFLAIGGGEFEYRWFVEVDRATHRAPALLRKAQLYLRYYQSGVEQTAHSVFPRIVWVVPTSARGEQLRQLFERPEFPRELMLVVQPEDAVELIGGQT